MKTSSLKMIAVFATVASLLSGDVAFAKGGSGSGSHSGGSSHSSGVKTSSSNSGKTSSNSSKSNSGNKTGSSNKTTSTGNNKSGSNKTSSTNGNKTGKTSKTDTSKTTSTNGNKKTGSNGGKPSKKDTGKTTSTGSKKDSGKHDKHDNHDKHGHQDKSCFSDYCFSGFGCYSGYCYPNYSCYTPVYCEPSYCEASYCEQAYPIYGDQVGPVAEIVVEQGPVVGQRSDEVEGSASETSSPATDATAVGSDEEVARTAVPAGSTLLVDGQQFGSKPGSAQLRIGNGTMKVAIVEWTANSVKVSLPKADQAGSANVDLEIVRADGSIASRTSLEVNSTDEVASNN